MGCLFVADIKNGLTSLEKYHARVAVIRNEVCFHGQQDLCVCVYVQVISILTPVMQAHIREKVENCITRHVAEGKST